MLSPRNRGPNSRDPAEREAPRVARYRPPVDSRKPLLLGAANPRGFAALGQKEPAPLPESGRPRPGHLGWAAGNLPACLTPPRRPISQRFRGDRECESGRPGARISKMPDDWRRQRARAPAAALPPHAQRLWSGRSQRDAQRARFGMVGEVQHLLVDFNRCRPPLAPGQKLSLVADS